MEFLSTNWFRNFATRTCLITLFAACSWGFNALNAQTTCVYTVEMFDSFGDGWNGNTLTVTSDGVETVHTLDFGNFGTSTFLVTDGAPVVMVWTEGAFIFEPSFNIVDPDGFVVFSATGPITPGEIYNEIGVCPVCPSPNPDLLVINQITDSSAFVNWFDVNLADYYIVEYGPEGFPLGTGTVIETTSSSVDLDSLNPCVTYDVYIAASCGIDSLSNSIDTSFTTDYTPPGAGDTCIYTLNLFDSFGDGWNGSFLTVDHNGTSTDYTLDFGDQISYEVPAISNLPIDFSFTPGAFLFETTYEIVDPSGLVVFSDGPNPAVGEVYSTIACPTCPAPLDVFMSDVNATNAELSWTNFPDAEGTYQIEYGPMNFTLGTGTSFSVSADESSAQLTGLEENTWYNVYIVLDCGTEFSKPIGPLLFHTIWLNDVGVTGITSPNPDSSCNLSSSEIVTVDLSNFGQVPQTLFEFYFAVNGVVAGIPIPQDGFFTGVVGNDSTQNISFETTWDFSEPGYYIVEAWTNLEGDSDPSNDTFRVEIITAFPKPIQEDFEDGAAPADWPNDGFVYAPLSHNNETWVIADNIFAGDPAFTLTTNTVGPVEAGDSLTFDYRYVDWFAGTEATELGPGDMLEVQISEDCGDTYETVLTIDMDNHVPTTDMTNQVILLDDFDGQAINVQFLATWGNGDYWIDLDNINITGCPTSLGLLADIQGSLDGQSTGSISVETNLGVEPYTFLWNTGDTTATVAELPAGVYEVTVTDANGCEDTRTFEVGIFVSADEVNGVEQVSLYPNPTTGLATLDVTLTEAMDFQTRVLNMSGQVVFSSGKSMVRTAKEELDLSNQPPGMYILQIIANGQPHYAKLMVTR